MEQPHMNLNIMLMNVNSPRAEITRSRSSIMHAGSHMHVAVIAMVPGMMNGGKVSLFHVFRSGPMY
jgi:hypothetical protein